MAQLQAPMLYLGRVPAIVQTRWKHGSEIEYWQYDPNPGENTADGFGYMEIEIFASVMLPTMGEYLIVRRNFRDPDGNLRKSARRLRPRATVNKWVQRFNLEVVP
jgi:hypothetical protein